MPGAFGGFADSLRARNQGKLPLEDQLKGMKGFIDRVDE